MFHANCTITLSIPAELLLHLQRKPSDAFGNKPLIIATCPYNLRSKVRMHSESRSSNLSFSEVSHSFIHCRAISTDRSRRFARRSLSSKSIININAKPTQININFLFVSRMKKQNGQTHQPPFVILRNQRKQEMPRVPLRVLQQTAKPVELETEDSWLPEPLSFGYTTSRYDSEEFMEEGQLVAMRGVPSPSHQILINYEDFD